MTLRKTRHPSLTGGPFMLRKGWPHDPAKIALRWPHEPANWHDDGTLLSLAQWIVGERRCCPFFTFSLQCEPSPGGLWMHITGPDGAKDVLRAELSASS